MKYIYLFLIYFGLSLTNSVSAQQLSLAQLEQDFLASNYMLLAAKYNIEEAQARLVQEKLWPNPSLTIDEVNLWSKPQAELLSPLFGSYGKHQQISMELEQLVETAGKRSKRVRIRHLELHGATLEFEELLRELKKELRQQYYHGLTLKHDQQKLEALITLFEQLTQQYARQSALKNVSAADDQRVQAELTNLLGERALLQEDISQVLHALSTLTQRADIRIDQLEDGDLFRSRTALLPAEIQDLALEGNAQLLRKKNDVNIAQAEQVLQQANAKPDINLHLGYDRGGNIMQDFIGLGVSLDLPIFNRNKGGILEAKAAVEQSKANQEAAQWTLVSELLNKRSLLENYEKTLNRLDALPDAEQQLMIDNYHKHLQLQHITLIEFIDFIQARRQADQTRLSIWENYNNTFEELQYLTGNDF